MTESSDVHPTLSAECATGAHEPERPPGYVYFIRVHRRHAAIKIGYAANPRARLMELQTSSPDPLEIAAAIPGDKNLEAEMHERFAEYRIRGEWFRPCPELRAIIKAAPKLLLPWKYK